MTQSTPPGTVSLLSTGTVTERFVPRFQTPVLAPSVIVTVWPRLHARDALRGDCDVPARVLSSRDAYRRGRRHQEAPGVGDCDRDLLFRCESWCDVDSEVETESFQDFRVGSCEVDCRCWCRSVAMLRPPPRLAPLRPAVLLLSLVSFGSSGARFPPVLCARLFVPSCRSHSFNWRRGYAGRAGRTVQPYPALAGRHLPEGSIRTRGRLARRVRQPLRKGAPAGWFAEARSWFAKWGTSWLSATTARSRARVRAGRCLPVCSCI